MYTHHTTEAGGRMVHVHTHHTTEAGGRRVHVHIHTSQLRQEGGGYMYTHTPHN